jgi:hypothetical protein
MTVEADRATIAAGLSSRAQSLGQAIISDASAIYDNGVFWQSDMQNTQHNLKWAALMATLAKYSTSDTLRASYARMVIESVEACIAINANAAGIFSGGGLMTSLDSAYFQGPDQQSMNAANDPTATIPLVIDLAWIVYQLPASLLPTANRRRWVAVCQANCDLLDTWPGTPITKFYINGNYSAQLCSAYAMTATVSAASKKARYWDMYERAYLFLVNPNSVVPGSWTGWGLTIDVAGTDYNWDDYEAHLTESAVGHVIPAPVLSFDWNYSFYTCDVLARLFTVIRDERIIRLVNAIGNKVAPRILDENGSPAWTLNGVGGSRQNNLAPMANCWLPVQALIGEKQWLTTLLTPTKIFSCWDLPTGNGMITTMHSQSYPTGLYPGGIVASLACIAVCREAAGLATVAVAAA